MYPKVVEPGTVVGKISKEISAKSGFAEGTPICVGIGDQSAATVGAGVVWPGMLSVSLGTGGMAIAFLDQKYRDPMGNTIISNHAVNGKWQFEGLQNGSAGIFRWFRDEIAAQERDQCLAEGSDVYEKLTAMAGTVPPGANGLLMIPHFATAGTPRWNDYARGLYFGMTFSHGKAHLARATMEGIILEQRDIVQSILNNGIALDSVRIIGGPTRSDLWNQIQADIYGLPAETLKVTDAAVLGAGLAGPVGIGEFKDIREAVGALVKPGKRYEPIPENVKIYQEMFDVYTKVYEALEEAGAYGQISAMQS
jgi:xylulokinase